MIKNMDLGISQINNEGKDIALEPLKQDLNSTRITDKTIFPDESNKLSGAQNIHDLFGAPVVVVENTAIEPFQQQELQVESNDNQQLTEQRETDSKPIEGEVQTLQEINALKDSTTEKINIILTSQDRTSSQEIGKLQKDLLDILAGRTWEEFAQQEGNSELTLAVETLKTKIEKDQLRQKENMLQTAEVLGIDAPNTSETTLINSENVISTNQTNDEGELVITTDEDEEEETISIKKLAALALFVTADMMFLNGNICHAITSLTDTATGLAQFAGFDIPEQMRKSGGDFSQQLIDIAEPNKLLSFLEERKDVEMYRFLSGLNKDTREKMLSGEGFGGLFGKHQLDQDQIAMVLSQLDENQRKDLNISAS